MCIRDRNNSTSEEIFAYYEELKKDPKIRVIRWEKEFNYSAINNYGARYANGEYLLFLNNDVTVITEGDVYKRQDMNARMWRSLWMWRQKDFFRVLL